MVRETIKLVIKTQAQRIEKVIEWQKNLSFTDIPEALDIDVIIRQDLDIMKDRYKVIIPKGYKKVDIPVINISGKWTLKQTSNKDNELYECEITPYFSKAEYVSSTHRINFIDKQGKKVMSGFLRVCFNVDKIPFLTLWVRPYKTDKICRFKILSRYLIHVSGDTVDAVYFSPLQIGSYDPVYNNDNELMFWLAEFLNMEKIYRDVKFNGSECKIRDFIKENSSFIVGNMQPKSGIYEINTFYFSPKMVSTAGYDIPAEITLMRRSLRVNINKYIFTRV